MEAKKVISKFDDKGLLELNVKRRVNFCYEISLIFYIVVSRTEWPEKEVFDKSIKIPSDPQQLSMSLGINRNSIIIVDTLTKSFLVVMDRSNPSWIEPHPIAKGEPVVPPSAMTRPASASSKAQKKKKVEEVELFEAEKQEKNTLPSENYADPKGRSALIPSQAPSRSLKNEPDEDASSSTPAQAVLNEPVMTEEPPMVFPTTPG